MKWDGLTPQEVIEIQEVALGMLELAPRKPSRLTQVMVDWSGKIDLYEARAILQVLVARGDIGLDWEGMLRRT